MKDSLFLKDFIALKLQFFNTLKTNIISSLLNNQVFSSFSHFASN